MMIVIDKNRLAAPSKLRTTTNPYIVNANEAIKAIITSVYTTPVCEVIHSILLCL